MHPKTVFIAIFRYLCFMMKDLPVGQANFEDLRKDNGVYVDKTPYIYLLISGAKRFHFLSRPRRFGKSLLLSTIKAIFEGKKELFEDLYIYDKIDWEPHPVIMLDMTKNAEDIPSLKFALSESLRTQAAIHGIIPVDSTDPSVVLEKLLYQLYAKTGKQVVVLVDEYEKPILDSIDDLEKAEAMRKALQFVYSILKSSSVYIRFLMLTGVSKISQTSVFSGLNQYEDLSLHPDYAGICGYKQEELEIHFDAYVAQVAREQGLSKSETYQKIKQWYNGYSWDGKTFVYNPHSVLRMFSERDFSSYWFASGTPTFLLKLLKRFKDYSPVLEAESKVVRNFDDTQTIERMELLPLFFQTGYLTIKRKIDGDPIYRYVLQVPNEEVRIALLRTLVTYFVDIPKTESLYELAANLKTAFAKGSTDMAVEYLRTLYANAAYHHGTDNEGYYHNLFEIFAKFSGMDILIESRTDIGRIDSVLRFDDRTYIIEIKYTPTVDGLMETASAALAQIKKNNYIQPFLHQDKIVHLLGLAFTKGGIQYAEFEIRPGA